MKDKIIVFVIGLLVGAVLSTGVFYIYMTTSKCDCSTQNTFMNGGEPPEKPNGENGQPPEKPNDNNDQNNSIQENN